MERDKIEGLLAELRNQLDATIQRLISIDRQLEAVREALKVAHGRNRSHRPTEFKEE